MSGTAAIVFAAAGVAAAGLALVQASALRALVLAAAALVALGLAFLALGAGFAGGLQILIYVGAIVVVFVFALATLDLSAESLEAERASLARLLRPAAAAAVAVAGGIALSLGPVTGSDAAAVGADRVGALLFGPWAVGVELASMLLLAALIALRPIARRDPRRRSGR